MKTKRSRTTRSKKSHRHRSRRAKEEEVRVSLERISEFEEEMSENTQRDSVTKLKRYQSVKSEKMPKKTLITLRPLDETFEDHSPPRLLEGPAFKVR